MSRPATNHAFLFDASACSGCKACQAACKDKNRLPTDVLWRRVVEVSGGEWQARGSAWENSVFAYNLSIACNHCVHPKCAGVCPTDAYMVRADGIVLLDSSRCMGCGYCAWACPYAAPQYNAALGVMTKCDLCQDNLDAGLPPACAAACPLRALDCQEAGQPLPAGGYQALWKVPADLHPFPLPGHSRTEPHLAVKPHAGMASLLAKEVANQEEVQPRATRQLPGIGVFSELPLVAFTLLTQMAAGLAVGGLALSPTPPALLLAIGSMLGAGGLISFLHLGRKRNAWRAPLHLRKSWLSREVLMAALFAAAWAITLALALMKVPFAPPWWMALPAAALVYSMVRVYRLHAVPAWDTWRTDAAFILSSAVPGALGMNLIAPQPAWEVIAGIGMGAELVLALTARNAADLPAGKLRLALLGLGIAGILLQVCLPKFAPAWVMLPTLVVVLASEVLGRVQFYASRSPTAF